MRIPLHLLFGVALELKKIICWHNERYLYINLQGEREMANSKPVVRNKQPKNNVPGAGDETPKEPVLDADNKTPKINIKWDGVREFWGEFFQELRLYTNKHEAAIKVCILVASWLASIVVPWSTNSNFSATALGKMVTHWATPSNSDTTEVIETTAEIVQSTGAIASSYLLFSLSILMEFFQKAQMKINILAKILHELFIASAILLMFLSLALVFGAKSGDLSAFMFSISEFIISFMLICFLIGLFVNEIESIRNRRSDEAAKEAENTERAQKYIEKSQITGSGEDNG